MVDHVGFIAAGFVAYSRTRIDLSAASADGATSTDEGASVTTFPDVTLPPISCAEGAANVAAAIIDNSDAATTGVVTDDVLAASSSAFTLELAQASRRSECDVLEMNCLVPGALRSRQMEITTLLWADC